MEKHKRRERLKEEGKRKKTNLTDLLFISHLNLFQSYTLSMDLC